MAELLKVHRSDFVGSSCRCGKWKASRLTLTVTAYRDEHAAHQASVLAANGYGKLEDAWDEGLDAGQDRWLDAREFGDPPINPYRRRPE